MPVYDTREPEGRASFAARLARLRATAGAAEPAYVRAAEAGLAAVRDGGDAAVVELERRWTDPGFRAEDLLIPEQELADAADHLDPRLRDALRRSIDNVRTYQEHIRPEDRPPVRVGDAELGLRWTPVGSVGCLVPGASATLFSTVVMLAVPAEVAGVPLERIAVVHPRPYRREGRPAQDVSEAFKAACGLLGLTRVYRCGGAQAVAALAYGTETIRPVEMIAGPGHPVVQLAKARVAGVCGTDGGFYGPSEVVVVADASADPVRVAADLLAQAEHDPGKCFLVCWDGGVIAAVLAEIQRQLPSLPRADAIRRALAAESCVVRVGDLAAACAVADELATEHLTLAVEDPAAAAARIRHAGEVFLGDATPVAAGDYHAGPSHCLPTGTTARFTSGVSVYTFMKRTGTVAYPGGMSERTIDDVAALADAEGLAAHAASARARR
ncbi:histidinol dehydrogenase [Phycisphaera mikurensis NBRC 102666]|uniref:Histidinol dehydrogenase n=2 Tax=Phycisphaera TaxID=666508 RepID=I0IGB5_PHYMF|nr:histidinol dehydrogenase [Phycisphaera mikurensis NBRC 102666]